MVFCWIHLYETSGIHPPGCDSDRFQLIPAILYSDERQHHLQTSYTSFLIKILEHLDVLEASLLF